MRGARIQNKEEQLNAKRNKRCAVAKYRPKKIIFLVVKVHSDFSFFFYYYFTIYVTTAQIVVYRVKDMKYFSKQKKTTTTKRITTNSLTHTHTYIERKRKTEITKFGTCYVDEGNEENNSNNNNNNNKKNFKTKIKVQKGNLNFFHSLFWACECYTCIFVCVRRTIIRMVCT